MEEWKPILGYEGLYEVSNLGRVKSIARAVERVRGGRFGGKAGLQIVNERILATHMNYAGGRQGGRAMVTLSKEGIMRQFLLHRLVATAFIPNPNNLSDASHIDHNPSNNVATNLEWLSHRENIRDSVRAGRWRKKLSEETIREIHKRAEGGEQQVIIAKSLGVAYGTVNSIVTGRSWRHISNGHTITVVMTTEIISEIGDMLSAGKTPAEILAALPRKRKTKNSAGQ